MIVRPGTLITGGVSTGEGAVGPTPGPGGAGSPIGLLLILTKAS
jgi:hypothetical protein